MPTGIGVRTRASTTTIYVRCRRTHLTVRHTLRFITIAPIAPLPQVTLLLCPDAKALCVVPLARRDRRGAVALLVA